MGMKFYIFASFIILFLLQTSSCFIYKDDSLILEKNQLNNSILIFDGYYKSNHHGYLEGYNSIYFFYKNGVVLYAGSFSNEDSLNYITNYLYRNDFMISRKKSKTGWGVFLIDNDKIQFETWEPSSGGPLKTVIRSGNIINDTSFVITNLYGGYTKRNYPKNDTFYFHAFSPKPDSTNAFFE